MEKEQMQSLKTITSLSQVDSLMMASEQGSGSDWGSGTGNCFFNCMEFVGSKFKLEMDSDDYGSNYHDENFWAGGGYVNPNRYGPDDYNIDSEGNAFPNSYSYDYLQEYFKTEEGGWKEDKDDIENMVTKNKNKEDRGYVFAVINKGEDSHAVILDGVTASGFTYKDPTSGERDVNVSYDNVCYATKIYGLKK